MDEPRNVDFIIVGQGIAGSLLAFELISRGKKVMIFNRETEACATLKAAGLYNPVTGKKLVKTWRADDLFPGLEAKYSRIEKQLGSKCLHPIKIYRPFPSVEVLNDWGGRRDDPLIKPYIDTIFDSGSKIPELKDPFGGVLLRHSGYLDLKCFISSLRSFFVEKESYLPQTFNYDDITFKSDTVEYGHLTASKVIFCEGSLSKNPFFEDLPFRYVRGETVDLKLNLHSKYIINQGVFMIPKNGYYTVGSTYDHSNLSFTPMQKGIDEILLKLSKVYTSNYSVLAKRAGVRPATFDRKPFIGIHKKYPELGLFNGFGAKGVSLVPYFASHFTDYLDGKCDLDKTVAIERVN